MNCTATVVSVPRSRARRVQDWQSAFRRGFALQLSTRALELLARGIVTDDARILHGVTSSPPPMPTCHDWAIEGADALGYCLWQARGLRTIGELEATWAITCQRADELSPESAGIFLSWWDETEPLASRRELLRELNRELNQRQT